MIAGEPIVATACVIAADLIGAAMMLPKTYRDPDSETFATYALASLAGLLATGAVGTRDLSLLLYPIYFGLVNGAVAILIHRRRVVLRRAAGLRRVIASTTWDDRLSLSSAAIIERCAVSRARCSLAAPASWSCSTRRSRRRARARPALSSSPARRASAKPACLRSSHRVRPRMVCGYSLAPASSSATVSCRTLHWPRFCASSGAS